MPRSKKEKDNIKAKVVENYSSGGVTRIEDALISGKTLEEFIYDKQVFPDDLLSNSDTIKKYKERLRKVRNGEVEGSIHPQVKMTLEEVGKVLGISAVMVAAKEGANPKKPLLRIDRNDLHAFCCLYQVSPHYLLGIVDKSEEYQIPEELLIKNPHPYREKSDQKYKLKYNISEPTPKDGKTRVTLSFPPENQTIVEWNFKNMMNDGSTEKFDGITLVKWTADGKISFLKEFGCNLNTYDPYQNGQTPQFRNEKANWF